MVFSFPARGRFPTAAQAAGVRANRAVPRYRKCMEAPTPSHAFETQPEVPSLARLALILVGTPLAIVAVLAAVRLF